MSLSMHMARPLLPLGRAAEIEHPKTTSDLEHHHVWGIARVGDIIVTGADDGRLTNWDTKGRVIGQVDGPAVGSVYGIAPILQTTKVIVVGAVGVAVWDTQRNASEAEAHDCAYRSLAVSPDGKLAAVGTMDGRLLIYSCPGLRLLGALQPHRCAVRSTVFAVDGRHVFTSSYDCTIAMSTATRCRLVRRFVGHRDCVLCLSLTDGDRTLASGSDDRTVRMWNVRTGRCHDVIEAHESWVRCVAYMRNGRALVTASKDGSLKLWDLCSGRSIATHWSDGAYCSLAAHEDLRLIVAGDSMGQVHFLRIMSFTGSQAYMLPC